MKFVIASILAVSALVSPFSVKAQANLQVTINFDTTNSRTINPNLHGYSQGWLRSIPIGHPLIGETITKLKTEVIRFPDGTRSNWFDWQNHTMFWDEYDEARGGALGLQRYWNTHMNNTVNPTEYIQAITNLGKTPSLVLNVYTMEPAELIAALQTLKNNGVNPKYIEMGNELYASGYQFPLNTYISRASTVAAAAKDLFPGVKIGATTRRVWRFVHNDWVLPDADWYDAIIVHPYFDSANELYPDDIPAFENHLTTVYSQAVQDMITNATTTYPGKEIWLTEWNLSEFGDEDAELWNTYANTFHVYHSLLTFLKYPEITLANYHCLSLYDVTAVTYHPITEGTCAVVQAKREYLEYHFPEGGEGIPVTQPYTFEEFYVKHASYWPLLWVGDMMTDYSKVVVSNSDPQIGAAYFHNGNPAAGAIALINKNSQGVEINLSGLNLANRQLEVKTISEDWAKASKEGDEISFTTTTISPDQLTLPAFSIAQIEIITITIPTPTPPPPPTSNPSITPSQSPSPSPTPTTPPRPGDVNRDGRVDALDYSIFFQNWDRPVPPGDPRCDFNGNNVVDSVDYVVLFQNWDPL